MNSRYALMNTLLVCGICSLALPGHAQTIDVEQLVTHFEASVDALVSAEIKQTLVMSDKTVSEERHFFLDAGIQRLSRVVVGAPKDQHRHTEIRVEGDTTRRLDNFDFAWGNKLIITADPDKAVGVKAHAAISHGKPDPGVMLVEWHLMRRFRLTAVGREQSLRELVASAPRAVTLTTVNEEGQLIYRLAIPHPGELTATGERRWPDSIVVVDLDPSQNYLARRITYKWIDGKKKLDIVFEAKDFTTPVEGASIPQIVELYTVSEGKTTPTLTVKTELVSVNAPILEDKLALTFPENSSVLEDATSSTPERIHFIGENGVVAATFEDEDSYHEYMEKTGMQRLGPDARLGAEKPALNWFSRNVLVGNLLLAILIAAAVVYIRKRKKKAAP